MACVQRVRTAQDTQLLPNKVTTEQQSMFVVKKLLTVAVSSITYLRGLFPDTAYGAKYIDERKVMILKEERSCPGANQIVQWMRGCFDAIQRKYKVTECYYFRIQYTANGPQMDIESNSDNTEASTMTSSNTKKASLLLVRKLYTLMQTLGPLPNNVCLNMKLSYYNDVTPQDYQPPGFKEGSSDNIEFENEPVDLCMGTVATPFHTLKVDMSTEQERLEQGVDAAPVRSGCKWVLMQDEDDESSKGKWVMMKNEDAASQVDTLVERTSYTEEVASMMMRSGRIIECTTMSQFEFPDSQEIPSSAPKRRKFSEPIDRN
ncbi:HORMA domain-containing protein 1 [Diretmus argenteus]